MVDEHLNLQKPKSSKIFGVLKTGANNSDQVLIKALQQNGYNEHEIQSESGVHYSVVRSFMAHNDEDFEETDAPITPETAHLHDRIAELEEKLAETEADPEE